MANARGTEGKPPLILEVEDQPLVTPSPFLDTSDSYRPVTTTIRPREPIEGNINEKGRKGVIDEVQSESAPKLVAEGPSRAIDNHAQFWSTYDKVSDSYDKELLDAWNKSLDILLVFAGLFSAINTAFIIESYKSLQPDPIEITNALLRLSILHRNDNETLSLEDLVSPAPSAVPINSIFFSSLSFSLTAAFGAVTAKQWLTEYANVGTMKTLHAQGKRRQAKFNGLKTWHFRLIIELLPMLLQISLFLFLIGSVHFLWNIDKTVATEQLALSVAGFAIYIVTIIIGIIVPTSPFQTPLSRHLYGLLSGIRRHHRTKPFTHVTTFIKKLGVTYLQPIFGPHLSVFIRWIRDTYYQYRYTPEELEIGWTQQQDSPDAITATEAVVWLLEQAEHPDVTMIALDAVPSLPPNCLAHLIQEREGLLERLIRFHYSLLPPRISSTTRNEWRKSWPNRVIVSGMALCHILKSQRFRSGTSELEALMGYLEGWGVVAIDEEKEDPMVLTHYLVDLNHCSPMSLIMNGSPLLRYLNSPSVPLICSPLVQVEPMDMRQGLVGGSFVSLVMQHELILDFILRVAFHKPDPNELRLVPKPLAMMLQGELSHNLASHVAITFAAVCWSRKVVNPWSYPTEADQRELESALNQRRLEVDKSQNLLTNIALALSMIDVSKPDAFSDPNDVHSHPEPDWTTLILTSLLKIATPLLLVELSGANGQSIRYHNFAQSILRLSRRMDLKIKTTVHDIIHPLLQCPAGDWILPINDEYGRDIVQLLASMFSADLDGFSGQFLTKMARASNDLQFRAIMESPAYIYPYHRSIPLESSSTSRFVEKVLLMHDLNSSTPSVLLETQICFTVGKLHDIYTVGSVCDFLNRMVQEDWDLHWPAYFITAGVVPPNSQPSAQPPVLLKFIDPTHLVGRVFGNEGDGGPKDVWCGEAILMLWRKGKKERANGRLPSDWDDSFFFKNSAVSMMAAYFRRIRRHAYMGIDWDLVKEYFGRALAAVHEEGYDFGKTRGGSQVRQIINAEQIDQIVGELSEYSNDRPPPPRDRNY